MQVKRIIQPREKEQPCCGGAFIISDLIFGRGTTPPVIPCTPVTTEKVLTGDFSSELPNWIYLENGDPGNRGLNISGGVLECSLQPPTVNSYFQSIVLDQSKTYHLTFTLTAISLSFAAISFIEIFTGTGYWYVDLRGLGNTPGTYTYDIIPAAWNGSASSFSSAYLGVADISGGIYITTTAVGNNESFTLDDVSLIEDDCI